MKVRNFIKSTLLNPKFFETNLKVTSLSMENTQKVESTQNPS